MSILDLYLHNSSGKLCRVPAFSGRWWILAALIGIGGTACFWLTAALLALICG